MPELIDELSEESALPGPSFDEIYKNTQGHILVGHGRELCWNLLLRFQNNLDPKTLATLYRRITSALDLRGERVAQMAKEKRAPVCFMGFSWPGCQKLGRADSEFVPAFLQGFQARAADGLRLTNIQWYGKWIAARPDAVLICAGQTEAALNEFVQSIMSSISPGLADCWIEKCARIPAKGAPDHPAEHFGFRDDMSAPVLPGLAVSASAPRKSGFDPRIPLARVLVADPFYKGCFGSFLAYVRIQQHVDVFQSLAKNLASQISCPLDEAEALLIGRQKDGTPLAAAGAGPNDFDRNCDPHGARWPLASHISKMNPRMGQPGERRPILRRGMTYDENGEQGLVFQGFQAGLEAQFELLLGGWAHSPNHPAPGAGRDPILTDGSDNVSFAGSQVCPSGVTTIRGGEYFYFPSIPGLQALCPAS
jgi:deferrochelatase/peroxidase EfeB